jgi:hypothetical protein
MPNSSLPDDEPKTVAKEYEENRKPPTKLKIGTVVGTGVLTTASLVLCAWIFGGNQWDNKSFALSVAIIAFGLVLGFCSGILISPIDEKERFQFSEYVKAGAAFGSGFFVAKLNQTVSDMLGPTVMLMGDAVGGFRVVAFVTSFIVGLMWMFGWRRYL